MGQMHIYAVREVTAHLRELIDSSAILNNIWVGGEVSNVSRPASGHVYFTLKDGASQLRAVFFSTRVQPRSTTRHLVQNGHAIAAHGRVTLYEQRGELQIIVDFVQPEGAGALQLEYERLSAKLDAEGLFDAARKRPLPRFPRKIGVVTSESGAVFQDIRHVLERRWPLAELVLSPTPVQGADAVPGIVGAIEQLNGRGDIDVIIAGRGGGSIEELWAFNDEAVARAIFASAVPVVSAVGHETDFTIADFVSDQRAPTPSAAAEIVSPDRIEIGARLVVACGAVGSAMRRRVSDHRADLVAGVHTIERHAPDVNRERQRVDDALRRAQAAAEERQRDAAHGVGGCVWRLRTLDPLKTLERGYAIVQRGKHVVSSVSDAKAGETLDVQVQDGMFGVHVGGGAPESRKRAKRRAPEAQASLFTMPEERV